MQHGCFVRGDDPFVEGTRSNAPCHEAWDASITSPVRIIPRCPASRGGSQHETFRSLPTALLHTQASKRLPEQTFTMFRLRFFLYMRVGLTPCCTCCTCCTCRTTQGRAALGLPKSILPDRRSIGRGPQRIARDSARLCHCGQRRPVEPKR